LGSPVKGEEMGSRGGAQEIKGWCNLLMLKGVSGGAGAKEKSP